MTIWPRPISLPDLGLVDLTKIQSERIDTSLLDCAVNNEIESGHAPGRAGARAQGAVGALKLKADIYVIFEMFGEVIVTPTKIKQTCEELACYPAIGLRFRFYKIQ